MTEGYHSKEDHSSVSLTSDELTENFLWVFESGHHLEEGPPSKGVKAEGRKGAGIVCHRVAKP
jgi:hypothetical protein